MVPTFDNGYLAVQDRDGVRIYRSDGILADTILHPSGHAITNVAVDRDGTAAATVGYDRFRNGVSIVTPAGQPKGFIETGDYVPTYIAFGPDHSLWVIGTHVRSAAPSDYFVLRHFSPDGETLGQFLSRSSFDSAGEPAESVTSLSGVRVGVGRIGLLLTHGNGGLPLWVEVDPNGKELGRWPVPSDVAPAALTAAGAVYARGPGGIVALDRASGKWNKVPMAADGILIGTDGNALVVLDRAAPRLHRIPLPGE